MTKARIEPGDWLYQSCAGTGGEYEFHESSNQAAGVCLPVDRSSSCWRATTRTNQYGTHCVAFSTKPPPW